MVAFTLFAKYGRLVDCHDGKGLLGRWHQRGRSTIGLADRIVMSCNFHLEVKAI